MKKIISLFLTVTMIASLIVAIPAGNVAAAETITDEALFMTYPTYLSNSEMDEGLQKAEEAFRAVMSSYSKTDELIAAFMTAMSEGISLSVQKYLGKLGLTETLYEKYAREAATKYIQSMLSNPNAATEPTKKIDTAYKALKTSYSVGSSVDKTQLMADLKKVATDSNINVMPKDMEELVDNLYDAGSLKKDLDAIGESMKLWKVVLELTEIHAIEKTAIVSTMEELQNAGLTNSDLYLGLSLLKADIEKNPFEYVMKHYGTEKVVSFIAEKADDLIFTFATGTTIVPLVNAFTNLFSNYVYVNAKADALIQASMQASFVSCLDICLSNYRTKFRSKQATTDDINKYEFLYSSYLGAYKAVLDSCYDVAKIGDKFSLGGDCMVWSANIEYIYTYDSYINWCKEEVLHDIENAELDKATGDSTISDDLDEATIKARLEKMMTLYPPDDTTGYESLEFACKVFNRIFDKVLVDSVRDDYYHILRNNANVRLVGRLEEEEVAESALKEMFANVRVGDIVITSGQYDYLHAMTVVEVTENGPVVYDVGSVYGPEQDPYKYTWLIQKYEFPYSKMADAFSKNGKYMTKPGISVYRAIKKVNTTNSGTSLYYEEYDDSVNYVIENNVLKGYKGSRTTIEIPDGVISIADKCFENNKSIKSVYMPDTITEIGNRAFYGCTNLKYVNLSSFINKMGKASFAYCQSLTSINVPGTVVDMNEDVFAYCNTLTSCIFLDGATDIGSYTFGSCYNLRKVVIPDTITKIGSGVFDGCVRLTNVNIPETVTSIGSNAFRRVGLKSITISKNVSIIGEAAMQGSFENIFVDIENKNYCDIDGNLFNKDKTKLIQYADGKTEQKYSIPNGTTHIGNKAFINNWTLTDVFMPDSVVCVGEESFRDCENLINITFSNNLTEIGDEAFWGCYDLITLYMPDKIERIGEYAFACCFQLKKIDLPNKLTQIGREAFASCENLTEIKIPNSVVEIGDGCFSTTGYANNEENWENGCLYIDNCLVATNTELSGEYTIKDGTICVVESAFTGNVKLTEVTVPSSVVGISEYMFSRCENLTKVEVLNGVKYIGNYAFAECINLLDISIPDSIISIGENAFYDTYVYNNEKYWEDGTLYIGNHIIKTIETIPSNYIIKQGTKSIADRAFERSNISDIIIPKSVVGIGNRSFERCRALKSVTILGSLEIIGDSAFEWCTALESVSILDSVKIFGDAAFRYCSGLREINVPNGVIKISDYSFAYCDRLREITIPKSIKVIGNNAFDSYYNHLQEVYYTGTEEQWDDIIIGSGNEYLFNATIHFNSVTSPEITEFLVGDEGKVDLSVANAPDDAVVYVASYDNLGKLLELQKLTLNNGSASAIFSTASVYKYKAFIWKGDTIRPLSDPKECKLQ